MRFYLRVVLAALLVPALFSSVTAESQSAKIISLRGGKQIQGKILGTENNEYVIETQSEKLRVPVLDVLAIKPLSAGPGANEIRGSDIQKAQAGILSDPELMTDIQKLAADPQTSVLISDPAFLSALESRDFKALESNPETRKVMADPKVRALIQKIRDRLKM